jgi:hypothetical protein
VVPITCIIASYVEPVKTAVERGAGAGGSGKGRYRNGAADAAGQLNDDCENEGLRVKVKAGSSTMLSGLWVE